MANSIAGVNIAQVAQETLNTLLARFPLIRAFSTDFSDEVAVEGESVTTRVASAYTAQNFNTTTDDADSTSTAKTINISSYKGVRIGFSDSEWSRSSIPLDQVFYRPVAHAVVKAVIDDAFELVTNANYSENVTIAAASFNWDAVAGLAETLSTANVPYEDRALIIKPSYYVTLAKDVKTASAWGSQEIIKGYVVPLIAGFRVFEYPHIPTNSENLAGIALAPQAILVAARQPAVPSSFPGDVASATDTDSGLTIQVRRWYSADDRKWRMEAQLMYGVAVGVAGNLVRILSA